MVTGYGDEATAGRAFKAGAAGYMVQDSRLLTMLPLVLGKALDAVRLEDALHDNGVSDHRIFEEAVQKIRESEELYRTLVRVSPDAITITDLDGKITFASDRTVELYRYKSPGELVGMSAFGLIIEEEHEKARTYMKRALEGSVARNLEYTMLRRDGSTFVGGLNVSLLRNHSGEPSGFMTTVRDMTERRETEALKASEQTLQTIFDSMPGLLFFKNKDNVIVRANMKLADSLGMKVEEIEGRPGSELFPEHSEEYWKDDLEVIESGKPKLGILEPVETLEGTRWLQTNKIPYRDLEGEIVGIIGFSVDVTERKRYEEGLKRVNAELEAYAHTVSHDLKGPLTTIGVSLGILRELLYRPQSEEARSATVEVFDVMERNVGRADELIDALLKLAEAGQIPEDVTSIDVGQTVERILEEKSEELKTKGITVDLDDDLGQILGDYFHIYQLFSNLISNAIGHNDSKAPMIKIKSLENRVPGGHRYLVRDNGLGISPEDLEMIFTPFFKGNQGGSGIGLATVEKIVELYDGETSAYNDNGACFEFTLKDWPT